MAPRLDSGALRYVHPFVFVMKSHSAQQPLHSALCFWEHFWNVFESWLTRSHTRTTLGGWVQPVHTRDTWRNVFFFSAHASSQVSRYIHSFLACFSPRSEAPDVKWCLDRSHGFIHEAPTQAAFKETRDTILLCDGQQSSGKCDKETWRCPTSCTLLNLEPAFELLWLADAI